MKDHVQNAQKGDFAYHSSEWYRCMQNRLYNLVLRGLIMELHVCRTKLLLLPPDRISVQLVILILFL